MYTIEIAKGCSQLTSIILEDCDNIMDASLNVLKNVANPDVDVGLPIDVGQWRLQIKWSLLFEVSCEHSTTAWR